jgi:hypothetical protein
MNEHTMILKKVSASVHEDGECVSIYESDNGLTISFITTASGKVKKEAYIRTTLTTTTPPK